MKTVNMHDARTPFSTLVAAAERGETVIIARHGRPAAQLTAVAQPVSRWSPEALAFFASAPEAEPTDFNIPQDDLRPLQDPDLF